MPYEEVDVSSAQSESSADEQEPEDIEEVNDSQNQHKITKIIKTLKHPSDSQEFMEHMLSQTMRVDNIKRWKKIVAIVVGLFAFIFFTVNFAGYCLSYYAQGVVDQKPTEVSKWDHLMSNITKIVADSQDNNSDGHHHGPRVQSVRSARQQMKTFEALQNISDQLTQKTEYDEYVNTETGKINMSKVCHMLSMTVWGLVMAKARASFTLSDIFDGQKRKKKSNKIFYICVMIGIAQVLKSCAENSYAENFINTVEQKIDSKVFNVSSLNSTNVFQTDSKKHHHGPQVRASNSAAETVSLDEIIQEREKEIENVLKSQKQPLNDLETMFKKLQEGDNKFDEEKLRQQVIEKRKNGAEQIKNQLNFNATSNISLKSLHKASTMTSFFFVGTASILSVILSSKYHSEAEKLDELNKIYQNPKARVVIGKEKGAKVVKQMKKLVKSPNQPKEQKQAIKKRKQKKVQKVSSKPIKEERKLDEEEEPLNVNQSFNYSLFDGQSEDAKSAISTKKHCQEVEMKAMRNHQSSSGPMFTLQQVQQMLEYQTQRMKNNQGAPPSSLPETFTPSSSRSGDQANDLV